MQDLHKAWGERVREERIDRGWSAAELARRIEVHEATVSRIETGVTCPNDTLKWRIAGVFGIRMDRLWAYPAIVPDWQPAVIA